MKNLIAIAVAMVFVSPSTVFGITDDEFNRAMDSSDIDEYGFKNKLLACDVADNYFKRKIGDSSESHSLMRSEEFNSNYPYYRSEFIVPTSRLKEKLDEPLTLELAKFFMGGMMSYFKDREKNEEDLILVRSKCAAAYIQFISMAKRKSTLGKHSIINNLNIAKKVPARQEGIHEKCLSARDYEGCVRANSGQYAAPNNKGQDNCSESGLCTVTTRGVDIFGLPKPMGWHYTQGDESMVYWHEPGRIPHKGQETRYLGIPRITRYYQNPEAGTPGSFIGGNTASTSCINIGSSVNCTTSGSSPSYVSGTSATPGGVKSVKFTTVYDCKDNTYASYKNGKVWIKWKELAKKDFKKSGLAGFLKYQCDKGDQYIQQQMKVLDLKL